MSRDLKEPELVEDEEPTEPEPAVDDETAKPPRRVRLSLPVAIGLALLLVAALAAAATFGLLLKGKSEVDTAASEALNTPAASR